MTSATHRPMATHPMDARTRPGATEHELERRLKRVMAQLAEARRRLHLAQEAARATEEVLRQRRLEREQAVERVTELAELAESLQRSLNQLDGYAGIR